MATIVKKYRILDYSLLSDEELLLKASYFLSKEYKNVSGPLDSKYLLRMFSNSLNLYNIFEELTSRYPEINESLDFEASLAVLMDKNKINASKN